MSKGTYIGLSPNTTAQGVAIVDEDGIHITDFASNATLADLLTCCNAIDANTDGLEVLLTSIDANVSTALNQSTQITNQGTIITNQSTIIANQGTDGAAPPATPGTGIRGWLRSIYDGILSLVTNTGDNATETTLDLIKTQTDKLTFTATKLQTTGEDGGGGVNQKDLYDNLSATEPKNVFDATFENHKQVDLFEHTLANGGTENYLADEGVREFVANDTAGSIATLEQHGYNQFLEGKEFLIELVLIVGAAVAGFRKRWGYFNSKNGWYFEQTPTGDYTINCRSNTSGTPTELHTIARAGWDDPLDGTGPSGLTFDLANHGRFFVRTQGTVGKSVFGIYDGDTKIPCHTLKHSFDAADSTLPFIERASLPLRLEVENVSAGAGTANIKVQGWVVKNQGEYDLIGFPFSASTGLASRNITARTAIMALRIKTAFGPGAKAPRGVIKLTGLGIAVSGGDVLWEVVLQKAHLGEINVGGAPTFTGINRSTVEFAIDGTTVPVITPTAGGEQLTQDYAIAAQGNNPGDRSDQLKDIVHNIALNEDASLSDHVVFVATPTGNSATINGASLGWSEFK